MEPQPPTAAIAASAGTTAAIKKGNSITITANATQHGGSNYTGIKIYQCSDAAGTVDGTAKATSATDAVSYTFTPSTAGTYYFKAVASDATLNDGTSEVITVTVVDNIDTYTLSIIDKSGNVALTTTVAAASLTTNPLPDAYRSPFVVADSYKYYNTIAEAQANSGSNLTSTDDWIQSTVYVGYDVDATKMAKAYAIWANNIWMHVVTNEGKAENPQYKANTFHQSYVTVDQKYDVTNKKGNTVQNGNLAVNTLPIIDNTYMWLLGNDPYYVKLKNKVFGMYNSPTANEAAILYDGSEESSAEVYCLTYWQNRAGTATVTDDYYRLIKRSDGRTVGSNGDKNGSWRAYLTSDLGDNDWNAVTKLYIRELPKVNINILNASDEVEYIMQGYYNTNATSMPQNPTGSYTPYSLSRACTSLHKWYYSYTSETVNDPVSYGSAMDFSKLSANANLYVKYTLDTDKWGTLVKTAETNIINPFTDTSSSYDWYSIYISNLKQYLLADNSSVYPVRVNETGTAPTDATTLGQWAFTGTPYNVRVINRKYGDGIYLGINSTAVNTDYPYLFAPDTENVSTSFEAVNNIGDNSTRMLLRPMGSFNGDYPYLYLGSSYSPTHAAYLDDAGANSRLVFTWIASTDIIRPSKVHLEVSNASTYVDNTVTLTATVTPDNKDRNIISNLAIEQQVNGEWSQVGTAYAGSNVEGASKNDETGIVTVTYEFTPTAEGTFNFRAHAVVDNEDQYSTAETTAGGDGDVVEIIATVKQLEPRNNSYTLTLIDKDGNELISETDVPKSRITEVNSISGRNGDPFDNAYRSPLVTTYKYYEGTAAGKTSAQAADDENLVDWNTYTGTTVYVGYEVSDVIDLNYKDSNGNQKFSSLNDLMTTRVARSATDATQVRNADSFGKMYMLKFKTSAEYNLEDGSDNRNATATPANTLIYPYTNGDGPIYMYSHQRYLDQKDNGASTRTRWPWFLVSPNGDPYHVYITSWQSSHTDNTDNTNHYSYLRTYYNSTINQVVTNNVTDDDRTLEGGNGSQIMPTDYMILNGSGTDGLNYKLMTSSTITDASTTERRTVTSFEQYWRNNPTAQVTSGGTKNSTVVATNDSTLIGFGWHNYKTWVNAANWTGTKYTINGIPYSKDYLYDDHWYMTVNVGDGSLDIVETNIDGVLVLLDNHGWEIMRQPIVATSDADYESVQAALKKYDSPMVKNYKFYSTNNVNHKVPGYHKYDITYQTSDKTNITGLTLVNSSETITSLANYPVMMKNGALTDLYVTYEVADDYANSYTGAATEEGTSASSFLLQQGSSYAKANSTAIESTSTVADADRWYLRPNFNIDAEMGYLYENGTDDEKDKTTLETLYKTNSSNGFDPYNLQIQNVNSSTYFTTNASTAALNSGAWTGNGSSLSLAAVSTQITPTGYDNKTLAVTNATFMAVKDSYGNMRLMPRFQHEQVVENFATLAAPATLEAYTPTNTQTTQLSTPVTYHIIDNSGNDALQMTVSTGIGLSLPDALKSPMVSAYQFHSTQAHAANAETRGTGDLTVAQENVYVSYTVDATKMASTKKYAISSGASNVFLHRVFRGSQSHTSQNSFEYRYRLDNQTYDQENANNLSPAPNQLNHSNLPFVDNTYLWTLGDDPYNIVITSAVDDTWKYVGRNASSSPTGLLISKNSTTDTAKYCLLYWNGDPTSDYSVLRYSSTNTSPTTETYVQYNSDNGGKWVDASSNSEANAKLLIEELPEVNVNVVNAAGTVEYTLAGRYISTATVPGTATVPFFLQRSYTSGHTYYYDAACEDQMTADSAPDATKMENGKTDDKYNIYVRYELDAAWNTENLFKVSTAEAKEYYILNYTANTSTPYMGLNETYMELKGTNVSTTEDTRCALYGTPYALRIENQKYPNYYIGIPTTAVYNTKPKIYNSFDGIISTWELSAYTNNNVAAAYKTLPFIRPQGSISRETPLLYLRPNGTNAALADVDDNINRVTFEAAAKVTLVVVDKDGREVISEQVSPATVSSTSGDPLSAELRSPYAKNYKYYETLAEAQANSGTELDATAISAKVESTVYVGYDINAADGETILHTDGTAYRIRRNTSDTQGMHATFQPSGANSSANNYGWKMERQSRDYDDGSSNVVNYNTLPFIDRSWAWEFVNSNGDPYSVKIRNKATGQYLRCENNSTRSYQAMFTDSESEAALYSLLQFGTGTNYLAIYVTDNNVSQTGYLYYNSSDGGTWRLRSTRNDGNNSALAYIRVEELTTPLDIHVVAPANAPNAGEVEATFHGYRNTSVGANTVPSFAPYFLARAYTSDQKFYYTQEAAAAATSGTEIPTVDDNSITDSYGSDGVLDVFVSYTLDATKWISAGTEADETANTTIIKPFYSSEKKINWYGIRANQDNSDFLKAESTTLPTAIGRSTISTATDDLDTEAMKRSEWAIIGTPYNLQLVERYHGTAAHLGMAEDAVSGTSRAYVYPSGTEDVATTFELVTGLSGTSGKLFLRPQGALNAQAPNLYIGGNDNNMAVSRAAGSAQIIDLTWLKETDAKSVTFTLRDRDGNSMSSIVADFTLIGVAEGDDLADLFSTTGLARRYCDYTYYSDNTLTTTVEEAGSADNETVYVQWQYTDDAPVFSTGSEPRNYQYYLASVYSGNSDYNYSMGVTGDTESGYTIEKREIALTESTITNQFALVGNPYAFKLYNRFVGGFISAGTKLTIDSDDSNDIVFDMAVPSVDKPATKFIARRKGASMSLNSNGTNMFVSQGENTVMLSHIVVPVYVFKEGATASTNIVDYQEYALNLNPNSVARATSERIVDTNLNVTNNAVGKTNDFRHAFCDYTFYHGYDWETGTLSNAIPSSGDYAGLPYYGGNSDQFARAFFATYTVDEEQFSKVYLLDNANTSGSLKYFGSGTVTTSGDNVYYPTVSAYNTVEAARNDATNAYRWLMTGDPYNLQLTCLGTGDDYQGIPLGVQNVCTTNSTSPTVSAGTLARLTNDGTYAVKSHWEVILNSAGNHVFFLTDDVTTYDDADRYTYSLGQQTYTTASLFASSDQIYALHLTPAIPQYNVIWNIMEGGGGGYTGVATYTKENVSKGTTLTLADMPEVLRRHFCEYENMYSNETCTTAYTDNEATVENADLNIYVPYTLKAGAPMFYASVDAYDAATGDDKDPTLIRLNHLKYAYTINTADESAMTTDSKETASTSKWVLIGSPYNVKLYNILTGKYLYVNWSNISPNAVIPMAASPDANTTNDTWTILDDATGDYAVLCLKEDDNHQMLFVGYDTNGNVVMNIPNSKSEAMTAEFLGSNGIDNPKLVLHYGENTLRKGIVDNAEVSMAGRTEEFQVSGFFNQGTLLADIMPSVMKRPFCNYTFKYNDTEYTAVEKSPMCTDPQPVTIDVYYTRDESLFKWSTANKDYTGKHWYYLVNNHVPAGSGEQGKMYYRDSSPKLRVSQSLIQTKLYLNNFEWCVIGDPYGFKMLNRYDPDRKFNEYISVMDYNDSHNDGLQLEQSDGDTQDVFEMMPGTYSYNFWMHPVYTEELRSELVADACSYVGNNYNGSAAIIPTTKKSISYLKANSSANLRLEIQSGATLAEYVKYAGFVGGLQYDAITDADLRTAAANGTLTDEQKEAIRALIDNPENIEQMKQGYYRIVPYVQETSNGAHHYVRGYLDDKERTASSGYNSNLKVETQEVAEYDPASIFWFEGTTDGNYPRYFIKTQGLSLSSTGLTAINAETNYKCRYEDLGAAITQIKVASLGGDSPHDYLSCGSTTATEMTTNQCFDEQNGLFKTRMYLQKVGEGGNEMAFKKTMAKAHDGLPTKNATLQQLPYTYTSIYVPYDLEIVGGKTASGDETSNMDDVDIIPFIGAMEILHPRYQATSDTYYNEGEYALRLQSVDMHNTGDHEGSMWFIPAGTPVVFRSLSGMTDIHFKIPTTAPSETIAANTLKGQYLKVSDTDATKYIFAKESVYEGNTKYYTGRVGFFKRNNPTSLSANKVYYVPVQRTTNAPGIVFNIEGDDSEPTDIDHIHEGNLPYSDGAVYDMQGRKVAEDWETAMSKRHMLKGNTYIVNGKKVIIK